MMGVQGQWRARAVHSSSVLSAWPCPAVRRAIHLYVYEGVSLLGYLHLLHRPSSAECEWAVLGLRN